MAEGAERKVELVALAIVAHTALEPLAIPLKNVGLSGSAESEGPGDGDCDGVLSIGDGVDAGVVPANNAIRKIAAREREVRMRAQDFAIGCGGEGGGHGRSWLGFGLGGMARRADGVRIHGCQR